MIEKDTGLYSNKTKLSEAIYTEGTEKMLWETTKRTTIVLSTIVTLCLPVMLITLSANTDTKLSTGIVVFSLIIWAAFIISIYYRYKQKIRKEYRKQFQIAKNPEQECVFGEKFVSVKTINSDSIVYYKQLSHIYETKHVCILSFDGTFSMYDYLLLDKHAFTQGTYEEFCEFLKKKTNAPWK